MGTLKTKLFQLYNDQSKHSNYQNIPIFVQKDLGYSETINEDWRGDTARYNYFLQELIFLPRTIIGDIGANTGFFTLSFGKKFPNTDFVAYESNANHVKFIEIVKEHFKMDNISIRKLLVVSENIDELNLHHTLFLLNVLHHAGYDYDTYLSKNVADFEQYALVYLKQLRLKTSRLIFQMGYNWGGDKKHPIILPDDDIGKIIFSSKLFIKAGWRITQIAMATRDKNKTIIYKNMPEELVNKIRAKKNPYQIQGLSDFINSLNPSQFIGEFYRRPIFICDSA